MSRVCVCVLLALCVSACLSLSINVKKTPIGGKRITISRDNHDDTSLSLGRRKRFHLSGLDDSSYNSALSPSVVVEEFNDDASGRRITFTKSEPGKPDIKLSFYNGKRESPVELDGQGSNAVGSDLPIIDGPLRVHLLNDGNVHSYDEEESQRGLKAPDSDQPPDFCYCNYDTLQEFGGELYGFKDQWVWLRGKPKRLQEVFIGLPNIRHVSAAYTTYTGKIALFYRRAIYEFDRNFTLTSTRDLSRFGLPQSTIELKAVFLSDQDHKTYLFEKKQYWRYDERTEKMDPGYPKPMPNKITSAMVTQGRTFFFNRCGYWYASKDAWGGFIPDKPKHREIYDVTTQFMWPCVLQE